MLPTGSTGESLKRNSLALVNIAYNSEFTWAHNGLSSVEQQMMIPLFSETPVEMGASDNLSEIIERFETEDYRKLFDKAFGDEQPSIDRVVKALASFVRSLTSFSSPFDDYAYRGQDDAINASQLRGLELFFSERFECFHCHGGFNFTQSSRHEFQPLDLQPFHNTGLYNEDGQGAYPQRDRGLIDVTHQAKDMGRFRAPTLRNVEFSAPYMHDGSIQTLAEVIDFYADGGRGSGVNSPLKSQFLIGFRMSEQEKQDLLAFLRSLSDPSFGQKPAHQGPINPPRVN
jgi:cytochrome c peroxidase